MRFGTGEIIVLLVVLLLVFGASKIPQLGDALGKGIRNFKRAARAEGAPELAKAGVEEPALLEARAPAEAPRAVLGRLDKMPRSAGSTAE